MEKFDGYLFSKLANIGTKSEGPKYFLQYFDYNEGVVEKKVELFEKDPTLHKFLNKKVTIVGKLSHDGIMYDKIMDYEEK